MPASHLNGCLGLAVRDLERASGQEELGGREEGSSSPKPATFLHPESQEMGGGGAFPDHSRHSEQSGGKISKRAMESSPALYNTCSRG